jgi:hypothetical protein
MRDLILVFVHVVTVLIRRVRPGGMWAVLAESVLLRHQLLILNRSGTEGRISAPRTGLSPDGARYLCCRDDGYDPQSW